MFQHRRDLSAKEKKVMERGARRCVALIGLALLVAIFSQFISGCKDNEPKIYRIETQEFVWENVQGERIPVIRDVSYLVMGE